MTLFSSSAITIPIAEMTSRVIRDMVITCLSDASFLNMPWKMFLENAEAAISRYESDELMVAARMPAITVPASSGGSRRVESRMKMFSAFAAVSSSVG